jgi:hypothetical protein
MVTLSASALAEATAEMTRPHEVARQDTGGFCCPDAILAVEAALAAEIDRRVVEAKEPSPVARLVDAQ